MAGIPNTVRRAGVYYFRRVVPADLRSSLLRGELLCSLRTREPEIARCRSRVLYIRSQELFDFARSVSMLEEAKLASLVQDFYATVLARENEHRLTGQPLADKQRQRLAAYWQERAEQARTDLANNAFGSVSFISAAMIQKHGLTGRLDDYELKQVNQAILRASCDLSEALQARFNGDFNFEPRDALLKAQLPSRPREAATPVVPTESAGEGQPLFSIVAEEFRQKQLARKAWENQTGLQARKTYQLFAEICDDRPLRGYVRSDAIAFRDVLIELPANYGKAAQFRGVPARQIVAATAGQELERLTPRTVQRHLAALSALWDASLESSSVGENIFVGIKLPKGKKANEQRQMWSPDGLVQLFNTPVWRGCQSSTRRSNPGSLILRDEKFWLPLLALFSGMRQEEICQLHAEDVRPESGVWVFDINARPPRQVKNAHSIRLVPIHSTLIAMGFLDYAKAQREAEHALIFPQLSRGGADLRFGHNFTKWFTRYRRDVGLYQRGLDFHSLRHSATTFMRWAKVPLDIVDALTGHVTPGETSRYTKSLRIEQLRDGIEALDPQVDLTHLRSA